jgi:hypothetical protein
MIAAPIRSAASSRRPRLDPTAGPTWTRADLLRRVEQAIDIARRALRAALAQDDSVHCSPNPQGQRDGATGPRPLVLDKVVAEAAMLARCALHGDPGNAALRAAIEVLALELAPHARGESVQALICNDPAGAIGNASAHIFLSDIGHHDERFERFLQEVLANAQVGGPERLPNQRLEWHWLEQIRANVVDATLADCSLLAQTCASRPLDVLFSSTIDLYVYTHVLLYASDMGSRGAPWPRDADALAADAEAALVAALDADNFDLAAELLWTWPMLDLPWSAAANFAFELLVHVQDEHGFLPGPEYSTKGLLAAPEAQRDDYLLRTSYHATFVMGMLCSAALRPGRAPTPRSLDVRSRAAEADPLLCWLPASSRTPRWLELYASLCEADQALLAPFLIGAALRRAAVAHDIGQLRHILKGALETAWSEGPAMQQALNLLRRANELARLRGLESSANVEGCTVPRTGGH